MSEVCVSAARVVTGLGPDLQALWEGAMAGKSAIGPIGRFATGRYLSASASLVEGLQGEGSLVYPLLERLLMDFPEVPREARLIMASTKGCIDLVAELAAGLTANRDELPMGSLLERTAARLRLADTGVNVNAACASSTVALARGAALIAAGRCDACVVVCLDLVSEFVFSGFSALQALSSTACRPFDRNRDGLTLGEGGAAILLMNRERARREGRPELGILAGWGAANDATHITAPARDACGLILAVRQALARAGIEADEVAAVSAHGTATPYNDLMEITAWRALFPGRQLPVHSLKGAIGHTLGAAGGIEAVLGLLSLNERVLPPTVGLVEPEEGGEGLVSPLPQPIDGDYLLSTNSGFGGVNAALVLKRGER